MKKSYTDLLNKSKEGNEPQGSGLFTNNGGEGIFSHQELISHMDNVDAWQNKHLEAMFQNMSKGSLLISEPTHVTENGVESTWLKFKTGRVIHKPLRIIHFSNIKQLIDDYAAGKIKITENLEQLYNEALES
ncbi:hypothetical protein [Pedobacter sp.]